MDLHFSDQWPPPSGILSRERVQHLGFRIGRGFWFQLFGVCDGINLRWKYSGNKFFHCTLLNYPIWGERRHCQWHQTSLVNESSRARQSGLTVDWDQDVCLSTIMTELHCKLGQRLAPLISYLWKVWNIFFKVSQFEPWTSFWPTSTHRNQQSIGTFNFCGMRCPICC